MANSEHYKTAKIEAGDGSRRVIITVEFVDDSHGLEPWEFRELRKGLVSRIMTALPGRYFSPHLSDTRVKMKR